MVRELKDKEGESGVEESGDPTRELASDCVRSVLRRRTSVFGPVDRGSHHMITLGLWLTLVPIVMGVNKDSRICNYSALSKRPKVEKYYSGSNPTCISYWMHAHVHHQLFQLFTITSSDLLDTLVTLHPPL